MQALREVPCSRPVSHLDDNAAVGWASGTLSDRELRAAETHLAACRECRALVAALAGDAGEAEGDSDAATSPVERVPVSQQGSQPGAGSSFRPVRVFAVGDRIGRYLVLSTLGAGGMGVVFAAYDPQLDRKVALKLLRAGGARIDAKDARVRLKREAQAIAQLSHPNVVAAYDVGALDDDDLYIAMEFVEGDTLTKWLRAYPRSWREIVDVFLQAARGLVAAHSVGLLHRDFKPDNVLVGGDGRVRVTDFGLARSLIGPDEVVRVASDSSTLNLDLTATGTVLGTPRYMAPEQLRGPDPRQRGRDSLPDPGIDARADQFSFCVALYEALYGAHPLTGGTSVAMLEQGEAAIAPPAGTKVPPAVARAVMRGLERERARRFPSMAALIGELVPPAPAPTARRAVLVASGVAVAGSALAAVVFGLGLGRPASGEGTRKPADIGPLVDQMNTLEHERRSLLQRIAELEERPTATEFAVLRAELSAKDKQIQQLVAQIVTVRAQLDARPLPRQDATQGDLVRTEIDQAQGPLEGCFEEWTQREQGVADFRLSLVVEPSGAVAEAKVLSGPGSVSLRLCVGDALTLVKYSPGPEQLELLVRVGWAAGLLNVSSRVVGHREIPSGRLDL